MWGEDQTNDKIKLEEHVEKRKRTKCTEKEVNINEEEMSNALKFMGNWKTSGPDGIMNFYLKKMKSLHGVLLDMVNKLINGKENMEELKKMRTLLLPKNENPLVSDYR